jgi:hypothetical protein
MHKARADPSVFSRKRRDFTAIVENPFFPRSDSSSYLAPKNLIPLSPTPKLGITNASRRDFSTQQTPPSKKPHVCAVEKTLVLVLSVNDASPRFQQRNDSGQPPSGILAHSPQRMAIPPGPGARLSSAALARAPQENNHRSMRLARGGVV